MVNVPINVDHRRPFLASFGSIFTLSFPDFDALQTFTSKQSINDVYELHESFNVVYNVLVYIYIYTNTYECIIYSIILSVDMDLGIE